MPRTVIETVTIHYHVFTNLVNGNKCEFPINSIDENHTTCNIKSAMRSLGIDAEDVYPNGSWTYDERHENVKVERQIPDTFTIRIQSDIQCRNSCQKFWEWSLKGEGIEEEKKNEILETWAFDYNEIYVKNEITGDWEIF